MLDTETRKLMEDVKQQLAEGNKVRAAVQQLEEQMRGMAQTIENKVKAIRAISYDDLGRYRGLFPSEADARGFGLYVLATVGRDSNAVGALKSEFKDVFARALGTDTEAGGGGLVPVEYSSRIQRLVEEFGVFAGNAFPMPMTTDSLTFQRRTTGLTVFKTGQNTAAQESQQQFATINLNADEWNTLTLYPKALGEDAAVAVGEMIAMDIAQAFAESIDDAGFIGDGTPTYLDVHGITSRLVTINGVDDGGGLVLGTGAGGAGWGSLVLDDFLAVKGRAPRYAQRNGKWYVSNAFYWTVMAKLILAQGGSTMAEFNGQRALQFLGDQVEIAQSLPNAEGDSQVCALYGDLRKSSTHGRRKELTIDRSMDVKFIERQVAVLGTQRHAINNHSLGTASAAGPIVGLITPAA